MATTMLRYRSRENAERVAFAGRRLAVVLWQDGFYRVVGLAEAQRLEREGYSVVYLPGR